MHYTYEQIISLFDYLNQEDIDENSFRHHFLGGYSFDSDRIREALPKRYKSYANGLRAEYKVFLRIAKETLFDIETKDLGKHINENDTIKLRFLYWRWKEGI